MAVPPLKEERVRALAEGYVFVLQGDVSLAFHVNDEVLHITGVMAFGVLQAVLLGVGIEMRAGGFEVGGVALGVLMKVDAMFAGREIVKAELEADPRSLLPQNDRADIFALGVLDVDLGFGCAGKSEIKKSGNRS